MDFSNKQASIFYIERSHAFYYDKSLSSPLKIEFPEDVFANSEVIDRKKFNVLIQDFIVKNKINPNKIIYIVLSSQITFEKDFAKKTVISETELQELLSLIPFEEIINKEYQLGNKIKIVSLNKHLCNIARNVFEENKFIVGGVVPFAVVKEVIPELGKNLNLDVLLNKTDTLRTYSLFTAEETNATISQPKKKNNINIRSIILVGILGTLIIILSSIIFLRL